MEAEVLVCFVSTCNTTNTSSYMRPPKFYHRRGIKPKEFVPEFEKW